VRRAGFHGCFDAEERIGGFLKGTPGIESDSFGYSLKNGDDPKSELRRYWPSIAHEGKLGGRDRLSCFISGILIGDQEK